MQALHAAKLGLQAQQSRINVIASNVSNLNTTGYKAQRVDFKDALYSQLMNPADLQQTGLSRGTGVLMGAANRDHDQGTVLMTGQNLDMYIDGDGYFCVSDTSGSVKYTRDGTFAVNSEADGNFLVNANGDYVLDENQAKIKLPAGENDITVEADGAFLVNGTQIARLRVVTFSNPNGLSSVGNGGYVDTVASGAPIESGAKVVMGGLEASNVDLAVELTRLIRAQRAFGMASRVVTVWDEMESATNNMRT